MIWACRGCGRNVATGDDLCDACEKPVPEFETAGPPDWVGIGAMKAGSTWWHDVVAQHPECRMADIGYGTYDPPRDFTHKELHHFDQFGLREPTDDDLAYYHRLFPRDGRRVGEWTPTYMTQWWTVRLLHGSAPEARLLVILRDPVKRYESELRHYQARPDSADVPIDLTYAHWHTTTFNKGLYSQHLIEWVRLFGRDRLWVTQYERAAVDFVAEAAATYRFLGVDDGFDPENRNRNPGTGTVELTEWRQRALADAYAPDVARLRAVLGDVLDPDLWPYCGRWL